jgi:hypothetical protein
MSETNGKNGYHQNGSPRDSPGGQGEVSGLTPSEENVMVRMMFNPKRRWNVTRQAKRAAMAAMLANLGSPDPRVVNGAVANILKMEAQNQGDQFKAIDKMLPDKNELKVTQTDARQGVLSDPDYLAYREKQRLGVVLNGTNGHAKNGHANGNGHE